MDDYFRKKGTNLTQGFDIIDFKAWYNKILQTKLQAFRNFLEQIPKSEIWVVGWGLAINSKLFMDFLKIS